MTHSPLSYPALWQSLLPLYDSREAQSVVRLVLEDRFGLTLTGIVCGGLGALAGSQAAELNAIMRRLAAGEPVQYVLGHASFCGRQFHVAPGVLIPRPETAQLCGIIEQDLAAQGLGGEGRRGPRIIDIGTGSGCIATTLALDIAGAEVTAVDISGDALAIATANARRLGAAVDFRKADILSAGALAGSVFAQPYDIVVSNPPYITPGERGAMSPTVLDHEPELALFVPDGDPLVFYRAIARAASQSLAPGGSLYFEINPLFASDMETMLRATGFAIADILDDDFGKHRFARARRG